MNLLKCWLAGSQQNVSVVQHKGETGGIVAGLRVSGKIQKLENVGGKFEFSNFRSLRKSKKGKIDINIQ